ncbi:MAG: hypothetical protein WD734_00100 [Dehalococcoidia bacterium]
MSMRMWPAAILAALLALASVTAAYAQATEPDPLEDGDIAWAFAQEDPFFDARVAGALGTAMEPLVQDAAAGARIARVEFWDPGELRVAPIYPAEDVQLLLDASGFGNQPPFTEVGQCLMWSASADAAEAAPALAGALEQALDSFGVATEACAATEDAAEAHVLVWVEGEDDAPAFEQRNEPTFLAGTGAPPAPAPVTPPGNGGSVPGSAGGDGTGPMEVVVELPPDEQALTLDELLHGRLAVSMGGVECAAAGPLGDGVTIEVGSDDQPAECREPGALMGFINGEGQVLGTSVLFGAGGSFVLSNFAPGPPHTGAPVPGATGHGGLDAEAQRSGGGAVLAVALVAGLLTTARLATRRARG